jgi:hypothetical protein
MREEFHFGEGATETVKNLFAAIIGDAADIPVKPDPDRLVSELEIYMSYVPPLIRMGLVMIIRGMEVAPLAMGYGRQFSNLSPEDRVKALAEFEASQNYVQRGVMIGLKGQLMIIYFSEPEVEQALGYDHSCLLPH